MSKQKRFLGIVTMTPFIQNEGVEALLDGLIDKTGLTAVACNTSVVAPATDSDPHKSWQPPADAGASVRLFDRPLWGNRALWLKSGPGHRAQLDFFADSPYKPRRPNALTDSAGPIIESFLSTAKARGLKVYIQTDSANPPGLREEDIPRLPNGRLPEKRMANTGSLASFAIRQYNRAFVRDIFARYPMIDGLRPDWPEYPCYTLDEAFQDFGPHVATWATEHGFDFETIQQDVLRFYRYLHGHLSNADLRPFTQADRGLFQLLSHLRQLPGLADWFRLKAALSADLLKDWREAMTTYGGPDKELVAHAFMPPFSFITGLDFQRIAPYCASILPKLYTMHWSLIIEFWGQGLLSANPQLDEEILVRALVNLLDLDDEARYRSLTDYGYPEPDQAHPIPNAPQSRKIEQAIQATGGQSRVYPMVHGYGPLDDFCRRLQVVADSPAEGVWINRYGYLSDEKLAAIGKIWQ